MTLFERRANGLDAPAGQAEGAVHHLDRHVEELGEAHRIEPALAADRGDACHEGGRGAGRVAPGGEAGRRRRRGQSHARLACVVGEEALDQGALDGHRLELRGRAALLACRSPRQGLLASLGQIVGLPAEALELLQYVIEDGVDLILAPRHRLVDELMEDLVRRPDRAEIEGALERVVQVPQVPQGDVDGLDRSRGAPHHRRRARAAGRPAGAERARPTHQRLHHRDEGGDGREGRDLPGRLAPARRGRARRDCQRADARARLRVDQEPPRDHDPVGPSQGVEQRSEPFARGAQVQALAQLGPGHPLGPGREDPRHGAGARAALRERLVDVLRREGLESPPSLLLEAEREVRHGEVLELRHAEHAAPPVVAARRDLAPRVVGASGSPPGSRTGAGWASGACAPARRRRRSRSGGPGGSTRGRARSSPSSAPRSPGRRPPPSPGGGGTRRRAPRATGARASSAGADWARRGATLPRP